VCVCIALLVTWYSTYTRALTLQNFCQGMLQGKDLEIEALKLEIGSLRNAFRSRTSVPGGGGFVDPRTSALDSRTSALAPPGTHAGSTAAIKTQFSHRTSIGGAVHGEGGWGGVGGVGDMDGISVTENTTTEDDSLSFMSGVSATGWGGGAFGGGLDVGDSGSVTGEAVPHLRMQIDVLQKRVREQEAKAQRLMEMSTEQQQRAQHEFARYWNAKVSKETQYIGKRDLLILVGQRAQQEFARY